MDPFTLGAGFGFGALLVGIIFAVLCRTLADEKGRSSGWWGLWGFLTTFIALIVLVLLPQRVRV
ncbi:MULTISPECIES: hypothetical protein [Brevibacterium]|uniref:Uncharacterized protein n=2 Tax=Brevibacterium antiquum TaxID=234835 RepID=A0A2H1HLA4_9MICO|nr:MULTISPECIES: hypothetical protein [Brevibacterium]SMX63717.1 hypothetical protein BANT918_00103 [Brevibacterium antiquum CNRZ 918]SMX64235.1 hypothetical protein BANT10_00101 [Brevibacterium antiquum]HCG57544.1 hypothetical protein [Brevibacterium sp.]